VIGLLQPRWEVWSVEDGLPRMECVYRRRATAVRRRDVLARSRPEQAVYLMDSHDWGRRP